MRTTNRGAAGFIKNCEKFTNHGDTFYSLTYIRSYGILNKNDIDLLNSLKDDIIYVVYSYWTPIAWVTRQGNKYRVTQKFSVTTTRHQHIVDIAFNVLPYK